MWQNLNWSELNWTESNRIESNRIASDRIGSDRIGLDRIGLDWIGLDWIGLDWIELDWIGLDWIGSDWIEVKMYDKYLPKMYKCKSNLIWSEQFQVIECHPFKIWFLFGGTNFDLQKNMEKVFRKNLMSLNKSVIFNLYLYI